MKTVASVSDINAEERSEEDSQELLNAHSGLKIALHVIHPMLLTRPLFESSQTALLAAQSPENSKVSKGRQCSRVEQCLWSS